MLFPSRDMVVSTQVLEPEKVIEEYQQKYPGKRIIIAPECQGFYRGLSTAEMVGKEYLFEEVDKGFGTNFMEIYKEGKRKISSTNERIREVENEFYKTVLARLNSIAEKYSEYVDVKISSKPRYRLKINENELEKISNAYGKKIREAFDIKPLTADFVIEETPLDRLICPGFPRYEDTGSIFKRKMTVEDGLLVENENTEKKLIQINRDYKKGVEEFIETGVKKARSYLDELYKAKERISVEV